MRHLDEGTLRRLYDEPLAVGAAQRDHYATCALCRERAAAVAADARAAARVLQMAPPPLETERALAAVYRRAAAPTPRLSMMERIAEMMGITTGQRAHGVRGRGRRLAMPLGSLAALAVLVGALALTPAGSLAQSFLTIFEPQQFAAVGVTTADLQNLRELPNLGDYGTMTFGPSPATSSASSLADAATASGLSLLAPATLPADVPSEVHYGVMGSANASFTFNAARAAASVATKGEHLPPMPAGLDGSTLQVTIGPAVVATYGALHQASGAEKGDASSDPLAGLPSLVVVQARQPRVDSTGAGVAQIEDYLLQMPGISPALAASIRAIGNAQSTLPVPIPVDLASAQSVGVQGVQGLLVGDNTGVGSGLIWQKNGVVYGVAGALPASEVLAIANSLH